MYQIFALRITYANYDGNKEKEEAFLDDETNFFNYFRCDPISKVDNYNAHVEGAELRGSLFSDSGNNFDAKKVRIETERYITKDEFNQILSKYIGLKDTGIIKIEAIEELPN